MPANLENSAVATGLEEVSFHSNPKERQCQRMLKLSLSQEDSPEGGAQQRTPLFLSGESQGHMSLAGCSP